VLANRQSLNWTLIQDVYDVEQMDARHDKKIACEFELTLACINRTGFRKL
jgi:hypothetical protein